MPNFVTLKRSIRFFVTAFIACSLSPHAMSHANETTRVMTFNIRYENNNDGLDVWPNRREAVIKTIRSADIVGLQEVVVTQYRAIQQATPEWSWHGVARNDGKESGEFSPIGFRKDRFERIDGGTFWLSETPEEVGSQGWDAALPRIATWLLLKNEADDSRLLVVNTHFDHRGATAREESGRLIASRLEQWLAQGIINDATAVLVMGDLNAKPESVPLTHLQASDRVELKDARLLATKPLGSTGTWNGFSKIDPHTRIDHILISSGVSVESYEVLDPKTTTGRFASDHLPVAVTIRN